MAYDISYFNIACDTLLAQAALYAEACGNTFNADPDIKADLAEQGKILLEHAEKFKDEGDIAIRIGFLRQIAVGKLLTIPVPSAQFDNLLLAVRNAIASGKGDDPKLQNEAVPLFEEANQILQQHSLLQTSLTNYMAKANDDMLRHAPSILQKIKQQTTWLEEDVARGLNVLAKDKAQHEEFNILLRKAYRALDNGDFAVALSIHQQLLIEPRWLKNSVQVDKLYNAAINLQAGALKEIAAQYFLAVKPNELYAAQKSPELTQISEYFNKLATHVQESILGKSSLAQRVMQTEYWIWVANQCYATGDFCSSKAIVAGLKASTINNLEMVNAGVSETARNKLAELEQLTGPEKSAKALRQATETHSQSIPYIGIYLTDLTFLKDGNPNTKLTDNPIAQKTITMLEHKQEQLRTEAMSPAARNLQDTLAEITVNNHYADVLYNLSKQNQQLDKNISNQTKDSIINLKETLIPNTAWLTLIKNDYLRELLLQKGCYIVKPNSKKIAAINKILVQPSLISDAKLSKALHKLTGVTLSTQEITNLKQAAFKAMLHPLLSELLQGRALQSQIKNIPLENHIIEVNKAVAEIDINSIKAFFANNNIDLILSDEQLTKLLECREAVEVKLDPLGVYLPASDEFGKLLQENYRQALQTLNQDADKLTDRLAQLDDLSQKLQAVLEDKAVLDIMTASNAPVEEVYARLIKEKDKVVQQLQAARELQSLTDEYLQDQALPVYSAEEISQKIAAQVAEPAVMHEVQEALNSLPVNLNEALQLQDQLAEYQDTLQEKLSSMAELLNEAVLKNQQLDSWLQQNQTASPVIANAKETQANLNKGINQLREQINLQEKTTKQIQNKHEQVLTEAKWGGDLSKLAQEVEGANLLLTRLKNKLLTDQHQYPYERDLTGLKNEVAKLRGRVTNYPIEHERIWKLQETLSQIEHSIEEALQFAQFNQDKSVLSGEIIEQLIRYQQNPEDAENFVQLAMRAKFVARGNQGADAWQDQLTEYLTQNSVAVKRFASVLLPQQISTINSQVIQDVFFELVDELDYQARNNPKLNEENAYYLTTFLQGLGSKLEQDLVNKFDNLEPQIAAAETAVMDLFHQAIAQNNVAAASKQLLLELNKLKHNLNEELVGLEKNSSLYNMQNSLVNRLENKIKLLENCLIHGALPASINKLLTTPPSTTHLCKSLQEITKSQVTFEEGQNIKQAAFHAMVEHSGLSAMLQGHTLKSRTAHSKNFLKHKSTHRCIDALNKAVQKQDLDQISHCLSDLNVQVPKDQLQEALGPMSEAKSGRKSFASLLGLTSASVAITAATLGTGLIPAVLGGLATAATTAGIGFLSQHQSKTSGLIQMGLFAKKESALEESVKPDSYIPSQIAAR